MLKQRGWWHFAPLLIAHPSKDPNLLALKIAYCQGGECIPFLDAVSCLFFSTRSHHSFLDQDWKVRCSDSGLWNSHGLLILLKFLYLVVVFVFVCSLLEVRNTNIFYHEIVDLSENRKLPINGGRA